MADYNAKIYRPDPDNMVVDAGGQIRITDANGLLFPSVMPKGSRTAVAFPNIAAADVAKAFFVAPSACKLIGAYEIHGTVCDAADTLQIEKCTAGEDAGAGDELLATAFTMNSTANTSVYKAAVTTAAATMAAGDALLLKFKTGDGTNYAEGCVVCIIEWI